MDICHRGTERIDVRISALPRFKFYVCRSLCVVSFGRILGVQLYLLAQERISDLSHLKIQTPNGKGKEKSKGCLNRVALKLEAPKRKTSRRRMTLRITKGSEIYRQKCLCSMHFSFVLVGLDQHFVGYVSHFSPAAFFNSYQRKI